MVPLNIPIEKSEKMFELYIVFQNYSQQVLHLNVNVKMQDSLKKIFAVISKRLKDAEEITEDLDFNNFKPAFMSKCRIVESKKRLWKEKGEVIQANDNHIFLLETRNLKTNEFVFGGEVTESEADLYLYIY